MANLQLQGVIDAIHRDILNVKKGSVSSPDATPPRLSIVSLLPSVPDPNTIYVVNKASGGAIHLGSTLICEGSYSGGGNIIRGGGSVIPAPFNKDPRNLALELLGRETEKPEDVTRIIEAIHNAIASGRIDDLNLGDYFNLAVSASSPFVVKEGYDTCGGINFNDNPVINGSSKLLAFRIVSKNGHMGRNNVDYDHVILHMANMLGYSSEIGDSGHSMETANTNANGYSGCKMRKYVLSNVIPALKDHGVPFDESYIRHLPRIIGTSEIDDKLFLPTEFEMIGKRSYANSSHETSSNQGVWEYYNSNTRRMKYNKNGENRYYWLSSASNSGSYFCAIGSSGVSEPMTPISQFGTSPAFCVA